MTITVAICTKNRPQKLLRCLKSITDQSVYPNQILIVDNSRPLLSKSFKINKLLRQTKKLKYVPVKKKVYLAGLRNISLKHTTSDLLAFIDDDAVADIHWVKNILRLLSKKDIVGVTGFAFASDPRNYWSLFGEKVSYSYLEKTTRHPVEVMVGVNHAVRTSFIRKKHILWDEELASGEDVDFSHKLKKVKGKVLFDPFMIVYHDFRFTIYDTLKRHQEYLLEEMKLSRKYKELSFAWEEYLANITSFRPHRLGWSLLKKTFERTKRTGIIFLPANALLELVIVFTLLQQRGLQKL